MKTLRSLRRKH